MTHRVFNFSAGPATLPLDVLEELQPDLIDWQQRGMSVMEISHRSPEFEKVSEQSRLDVRDLLNVPDNYHVLFMQGGGQGQFSMVPLNLFGKHNHADYFDTGIWSELAIREAEKYGTVNVVTSSSVNDYTTIEGDWTFSDNAAYVHYTDNETINGIEFPSIPETDKPLVCDMCSNLFSRTFDVSKFGVIYAAAQKNFGPAGVTLVIVRDDLLDQAMKITPRMYHYKTYVEMDSVPNTAPTLSWYVASLVLKWLKKQGGVAAIEKLNAEKANKLYAAIGASDFYHNKIDPSCRSRMNVVFNLADESLTQRFIQESTEAGLANLRGHRRVGGLRASIYNAMPMAGVDALIDFMKAFEQHV